LLEHEIKQKNFPLLFQYIFCSFRDCYLFSVSSRKRIQQVATDGQLNSYVHTIHNFIQSEKPTWEELTRFVRLFPDSTLRVTIIDSLGNVIFDSSLPKGTHFQNHLNRPEIAKRTRKKLEKLSAILLLPEKTITTWPNVSRNITFVALYLTTLMSLHHSRQTCYFFTLCFSCSSLRFLLCFLFLKISHAPSTG
jgi:hypothetical protein